MRIPLRDQRRAALLRVRQQRSEGRLRARRDGERVRRIIRGRVSDAKLVGGGASERLCVAYHRDDVDSVGRALGRLLNRKNPPTALVVSNSYAYLATTSLLAQRGWRIPQDISLISRDDDPFLGSLAPAPARYIVSPHAFAKKMIGPLLQLVAHDPVVRTRAALQPKFTAGGSMARVGR